MKNPRLLALTLVMLVLGVSLIAGAVLSLFSASIFPVDKLLGSDSSAGSLALGIGICVAAVRPLAHTSWVRIAIIYAVVALIWQLIEAGVIGTQFSFTTIFVSLICAVLIIVLHPNRSELVPTMAQSTDPAPVV